MTAPDREQQIKERLEGARSGPWCWTDAFPLEEPGLVQAVRLATEDFTTVVGCPQGNLRVRRTDADFIAHAPEDVAYLLEETERLRGEVENLRGFLSDREREKWQAEMADEWRAQQ